MRFKKIFCYITATWMAIVLSFSAVGVFAEDAPNSQTANETETSADQSLDQSDGTKTSDNSTTQTTQMKGEQTVENSEEQSENEASESDDASQVSMDSIPDDQKTHMGVTLENQSTARHTFGRRMMVMASASSSNAYIRGNNYTSYEGIDVSLWQDDIDWQKVAASGIKYAIIKVGGRGTNSGTLYADPWYKSNLSEAKANGIKVGVYFFTAAISEAEAKQEAEYTISLLQGYSLDLPVYFDYEWTTGYRSANGASKAERTAIAETFCDTMHANGYTTGVYASASPLTSSMDGAALAQKYRMWVANYNTHITYYSGAYDAWQYSSTGSVNGISGSVDMDHFYDVHDAVPDSEKVNVSAVRSITDGVYTMHALSRLSACVDIYAASKTNGGNADLYDVNLSDAQKFKFTYLGDGTYKITNVGSGLVLDVYAGSYTSGANIQQYAWNGTKAQRWIVVSAGNGNYQIINAGSKKALTVDGGTFNTTNINQQFNTGSSSQYFRLTSIPGSAAVSNGQYSIASVANPNYVAAVQGSSTASGANIQLTEFSMENNKQFKVTYQNDGTYSLVNVYSGKAIAIEGGGTANGTNVIQETVSGNLNQKWYILKTSPIAYKINSALTGASLDICYCQISDGSNIQSYEPNGSTAQYWNFEKTGIGDISGSYTIQTAVKAGFCLDVYGASKTSGGNAQLYQQNGTDAQTFIFKRLGNGYYQIKNKNSSLVLDVLAASKSNFANVQQYSWNGTDAQLWKVRQNSDGTYTLINRGSGKVLDLYGAEAVNWQNVDQYSENGTAAQKWKLIDASDAKLSGIYTIRNAYKTQYAVDIAAADMNNGGNVQIYTHNGTNAQKFQFIPASNGYYYIRNVNSGKVVDVTGGGLVNSVNIQQYSLNYTYAQQWKIQENGDKTYTFINRGSGKAFDVPAGNFFDGANISQYTVNNTNAQKFYLTRG